MFTLMLLAILVMALPALLLVPLFVLLAQATVLPSLSWEYTALSILFVNFLPAMGWENGAYFINLKALTGVQVGVAQGRKAKGKTSYRSFRRVATSGNGGPSIRGYVAKAAAHEFLVAQHRRVLDAIEAAVAAEKAAEEAAAFAVFNETLRRKAQSENAKARYSAFLASQANAAKEASPVKITAKASELVSKVSVTVTAAAPAAAKKAAPIKRLINNTVLGRNVIETQQETAKKDAAEAAKRAAQFAAKKAAAEAALPGMCAELMKSSKIVNGTTRSSVLRNEVRFLTDVCRWAARWGSATDGFNRFLDLQEDAIQLLKAAKEQLPVLVANEAKVAAAKKEAAKKEDDLLSIVKDAESASKKSFKRGKGRYSEAKKSADSFLALISSEGGAV